MRRSVRLGGYKGRLQATRAYKQKIGFRLQERTNKREATTGGNKSVQTKEATMGGYKSVQQRGCMHRDSDTRSVNYGRDLDGTSGAN